MTSSRGRFEELDDSEAEPVRLHTGLWAGLGLGGIVVLGILGIAIATLVIVVDNQNELDKIWHFNKHVRSVVIEGFSDSSSDSRDDDECDTCLQPFGPCTKTLGKLLKDTPCCVTVFEDKFVAKIPIKPKKRGYSGYDDGPDSRWKYAVMDEHNCKAMKPGKYYDADDCTIIQDEDNSFAIESEPTQFVSSGELGTGTGVLDTLKFAMGPVGAYPVRKDTKIVLQAVVKASVKLPKWHPYEWAGDRDDPRLGHVGPMLWDWDSGIAAGVVFTETGVWTMYNRQSTKHGYGNWHSAKRHYDNEWGKVWCIRIVFCSKTWTISIYINDKLVHVIKDLGKLPERDHRDMFVYRGGEPETAFPESFYAYLCGGTVLDAAIEGDAEGLLQLDDYAYVEPSKFRHSDLDKKDKDKHVFGQKLLIVVVKFKVDVCEEEEEEMKKKHDKHRKSSSDSDDSSKSRDKHHHKSSSSDSDDKHKHKKSRDDSSSDSDWKDDKWRDDKWKDDKWREDDWKDDGKDDKWREEEWEREKSRESDEKWKDGDREVERHRFNEENDKHRKQKWEASNSERFKKWGDDFEFEKSENEKHLENDKEHHQKEKEWEKKKGG